MRKLAVVVLTTASLFAIGGAHAEVKIKGKNDQSVTVKGAVLNAAIGPAAEAKQALASNVGKVNIGGDNKQAVDVKGAVLNAAIGPAAKAHQALSSNVGD